MCVVHADLAPTADGQMIFRPGPEPHATTRGTGQPARLGLAFVTFVGHGEVDELTFVEDGVVIALSEPSFQSLRAALVAAERRVLPLQDGLSLELSFRHVGWVRHELPLGWGASNRVRTGRLERAGFVLLTPERQLEERASAEVIQSALVAVEAELERLAAVHPVASRQVFRLHVVLDVGRRPELSFPGGQGEPPASARPLLRAILPVVPVFGRVELLADYAVHPDASAEA